jgi:hypothetical protein
MVATRAPIINTNHNMDVQQGRWWQSPPTLISTWSLNQEWESLIKWAEARSSSHPELIGSAENNALMSGSFLTLLKSGQLSVSAADTVLA